MKHPGQHGEMEVIIPLLPHKGFLIDIGCGDGETISNSRELLLSGWSGVLIDYNIDRAVNLYKDNSNVFLIAATLTSPARPVFLKKGSDSTLDRFTDQEFSNILMFGTDVGLVMSFCTNRCPTADFISLDIEDSTTEVLDAILIWYLPKVFCIEANTADDAERQFLSMHKFGYKLFKQLNVNYIYVR